MVASGQVDAHTGCVGTWFLLLVLVVGGLGAIRLRRGRSSPLPLPVGRAAVDSDLTDLDAVFDRVCAAHAHELGILLGARLTQLVHRQVPVRAIRQAPGARAVRVCFADGTVVLARGHAPGDFARIAWALHGQSVRLAAFATDEDGTHLDFRWRPDHRMAAVAVGLDQPD